MYQLQPKYLVTNFNFEAMAATVTESDKQFGIKLCGGYNAKGCNYVALKYPLTVAAFYFDWKDSDLKIHPVVADSLKDYEKTSLFKSVEELTIKIRGGDDDKSIKDGGSVASRKVYYRMCRDVLFPHKVQSTQGDQS